MIIELTTSARPVRYHIKLLEKAGWSRRSIAAAAGLSDNLICDLARTQTRCLIAVHDRITSIDPTTLPTTGYQGADPQVPNTGTFRRIQALLALGWSHRHLRDLTGIDTGPLMAKARPRVRRSTHDAIAMAYHQLATTPGPSDITRRRATARGYISPAGWDDIDRDPRPTVRGLRLHAHKLDVDPVVVDRVLAGENLPTRTAERIEIVARWTDATGRSLNDLARLTGWKVERYHQEDAA